MEVGARRSSQVTKYRSTRSQGTLPAQGTKVPALALPEAGRRKRVVTVGPPARGKLELMDVTDVTLPAEARHTRPDSIACVVNCSRIPMELKAGQIGVEVLIAETPPPPARHPLELEHEQGEQFHPSGLVLVVRRVLEDVGG